MVVRGLPALSLEALGDVLHVAPAVTCHVQSLVQVELATVMDDKSAIAKIHSRATHNVKILAHKRKSFILSVRISPIFRGQKSIWNYTGLFFYM